ncbi:MAG: hypothetical protein ACFFAU_19260 [Candidatus Hodarchaeota archaeon]
MDEKESISYVILLAVSMFIMPGTLADDSPLYTISLLLNLGAIILLAVAMLLIAVKNIPFFTPYIPVGLGDNIIKLLAWIGVLIVAILIIIISFLNSLAG